MLRKLHAKHQRETNLDRLQLALQQVDDVSPDGTELSQEQKNLLYVQRLNTFQKLLLNYPIPDRWVPRK